MEARILDGALPFPTLSDGALEMLALINPIFLLKMIACDKGCCPFPARELAMEIRPEIQGYPTMSFWFRWEEPARQADAGDALLAWVGVKPCQRFTDGSTGKQRAALVGAALIRLPEVTPPSSAEPSEASGNMGAFSTGDCP
jgi:hypothetical protein